MPHLVPTCLCTCTLQLWTPAAGARAGAGYFDYTYMKERTIRYKMNLKPRFWHFKNIAATKKGIHSQGNFNIFKHLCSKKILWGSEPLLVSVDFVFSLFFQILQTLFYNLLAEHLYRCIAIKQVDKSNRALWGMLITVALYQ